MAVWSSFWKFGTGTLSNASVWESLTASLPLTLEVSAIELRTRVFEKSSTLSYA
jgi:hypothetical protein